MKTKTTKTRIALYVTEEHKKHEQWYHVRATIVTIGANAWERRCRDDGSYAYPDITHDTIRNASDDDVNGLYGKRNDQLPGQQRRRRTPCLRVGNRL